jgi:hypothetical protein
MLPAHSGATSSVLGWCVLPVVMPEGRCCGCLLMFVEGALGNAVAVLFMLFVVWVAPCLLVSRTLCRSMRIVIMGAQPYSCRRQG